jgi:hypothetical protein
MELIDLASAHLETVRTRINELMQQSQQINSEVQRLNEILEEGSRLVENTITPSSNSNV